MNMRKALWTTLLVVTNLAGIACAQGSSQSATACRTHPTQQWDAVLRRTLVIANDCEHPERPARLTVSSVAVSLRPPVPSSARYLEPMAPLRIHAGDTVRLWQQTDNVRIEMAGVAEQSAHDGDRITVRVTHQNDGTDLSVERIAGIVRGTADVEMER